MRAKILFKTLTKADEQRLKAVVGQMTDEEGI